MKRDPLSVQRSVKATTPPRAGQRAKYHPDLVRLRGRRASGVYAIYDDDTYELLYIGESHTGRLYDTITRHFRAWTPDNDPQGRRRGGTTYDRRRVRVAYELTTPDLAQATQYAAILMLDPRDNQVDGSAAAAEAVAAELDDDDAPF